MSQHYILTDSGEIEPVSLMEWAIWYEASGAANRVVEKTQIDDAEVSTVFLGLDHSFGDGPPLLFETMIFGGKYDQHCWRYPLLAQAKAGHTRIVVQLSAGHDPYSPEEG